MCFALSLHVAVVLAAMAHSQLYVAARAFVSVLLLLGRSYELVLNVTRDSDPEQLVRALPGETT